MNAPIRIPYSPRPLQRELHDSLARFNVLVAHRRWGKTVFCVNALLKTALTCPHPRPRVAYIAPLYRQAKAVAWDFVKHYSRSIPGTKFNEAELRADYPNGARLQLYGADSPDHLRGIGLDLAVLDEYAQISPRVWPEIVRPALSDRGGGAIFIGTPMGRNHFHDLYQMARADDSGEWQAVLHRASETGVLSDAELASAAKMMTDDEFAQEFGCSFTAAIKGAFYAKELAEIRKEGRICAVPYEPSLPVATMWDLGIDDATAVWFAQRYGKEIRFIEYREWKDTALQEIAREVLAMKYNYFSHVMPHDIKVRELSNGKQRLEHLESMGMKHTEVAPRAAVADGILATRTLLAKSWFDEKKCDRGLTALESYKKSWDDLKQVFREQPYHDWASHAADAIRVGALMWSDRPSGTEPGAHRPRVFRAIGGNRRQARMGSRATF